MMLVGEIGQPRTDYLYEMTYIEILLIVKGYFRRNHSGWEQARLVAYNARYCMGSKEPPPPVSEWLPFHWEKETQAAPAPTEEEVDDLKDLLSEMNK